MTPIAGTGQPGFSGDGRPAIQADLNAPQGIAIDPAGNAFISDIGNNRIRRIAMAIAEGVKLYYPNGVAVEGSGDVFIADSNNVQIRKVAADGTVSTIATGTIGLSSLGAPTCLLYGHVYRCGPQSVAADAAGNVDFADTFGSKVVRVSDGAAIAVNAPSSSAVDSAGNVYAVGFGQYVTKLFWSGPAAHIAGNGADIDNKAFGAGFGVDPLRVTDAAGNVYNVDENHFQVTKTAAGTGVVSVVAGNSSPGFSGDGGPAIQAGMNPSAIAFDGAGNLYIADSYRVPEVTTDGIIHTVAGNDGPTSDQGG